MSISSLKLFKVAVPLKKVVKHASFERSVSENLVVRVTLVGRDHGLRRRGPAVLRDRRDAGIGLRGSRSARLGSDDRPAGELRPGRRAARDA